MTRWQWSVLMSSGADGSKLNSEEGLKQVIGLLKFTLALATGALVFSAGLLTEDIQINSPAKCFLLFSWIGLAISAAAGVLAYMRIPMLIAEQNFDMRDKFMEIPGRVHHISFLVGLLSLGGALVIALMSK